jgi:hypothetical protein
MNRVSYNRVPELWRRWMSYSQPIHVSTRGVRGERRMIQVEPDENCTLHVVKKSSEFDRLFSSSFLMSAGISRTIHVVATADRTGLAMGGAPSSRMPAYLLGPRSARTASRVTSHRPQPSGHHLADGHRIEATPILADYTMNVVWWRP